MFNLPPPPKLAKIEYLFIRSIANVLKGESLTNMSRPQEQQLIRKADTHTLKY